MKRTVLYLGVVLVLNNCISFTNPVNSFENAVFNNKLLGIWEFTFEGQKFKVQILNNWDGRYYTTIYDDNFRLQLGSSYSSYLTEVDNKVYLNIERTSGEYLLYSIVISKDKFLLREIGRSPLMDLIGDKKIQGSYDKFTIEVNSSSEDIRNLLRSYDFDTLFPVEREVKFIRVK